MPGYKRKRGTVKKYKSSGVTGKMRRRVFKRGRSGTTASQLSSRVTQLYRMIETKHGQWCSANNIAIAHNNITLVLKDDGGPLNPFQMSQGVGDPMSANNAQRIGDRISVKGLQIRGFFEGALNRSKVYFRVMLVKSPKGETPTRATLFRGMSDNKMIDSTNSERFTIVWQKIFNVTPPNSVAQNADAAGQTLDARIGMTGNRIIKAWIPGRKFGRGGNLQYEDGATAQLKFFDYRFFVLAYDWYGTPQDINTVGRINEMYTTLYFKDA